MSVSHLIICPGERLCLLTLIWLWAAWPLQHECDDGAMLTRHRGVFVCICDDSHVTTSNKPPSPLPFHSAVHVAVVNSNRTVHCERMFTQVCLFLHSRPWATTTRASCPSTAPRRTPPRALEGSLVCKQTALTRYVPWSLTITTRAVWTSAHRIGGYVNVDTMSVASCNVIYI